MVVHVTADQRIQAINGVTLHAGGDVSVYVHRHGDVAMVEAFWNDSGGEPHRCRV